MTDAHSQNWNFNTIFAQTVAMGTGRQLASPHVVLPFLFVAAGGPILVAALIVPTVEICRLFGSAGAAPVIRSAAVVKWHLALILAATAAALAVIGVTTRTDPGAGLAVVFLGVAAIIGFGMAASMLAHQDLLGRLLSETGRGRLMYGEAIFSGVLAIAVVAGGHVILGEDPPLDRHLSLLWAGAFIFAISAILVAIVREELRPALSPSGSPKSSQGFFGNLRTGVAKVAELRWARKFLVARLLFLSVELALPFYAIHAAIHHKGVGAGLTVLLIATSAAMILAGLLWRWTEASSRTVMVAGTVFAGAGGLLALAIDVFPELQLLALHGVVLFLVAFGAVSIVSARSLYLIDMSPEADRPTIIAVASVSAGAVAILAAFVLGLMAQEANFYWPICGLVALTLVAGLWAAWLPRTPQSPASAERPEPPAYRHHLS